MDNSVIDDPTVDKPVIDKTQLAILKTKNNEREYFGNKLVFIDNKSKITNVIFTPINQEHYMMISWFNNLPEYNYLYFNPNTCDYKNIDSLTKTISSFNSEKYNMIGVSYGASAAIVYSTIFPTSALIIVDPLDPVNYWNNIEPYILKLSAKIFYHRSSYHIDIEQYIKIRNALEKTNCFYMIQCSLINEHCAYVPNEDLIMSYIKFSEKYCDTNNAKKTKSN
jgi:hypothetical protein